MLMQIDWSDYDVSGTGAAKLGEGASSKIGRAVEETTVSYKTMGLTAISLAAVGAGVALRQSGRLRLR